MFEDTVVHPTLYKRDNLGKIRTWWIEQQAERYRFCYGIKDETITRTEWTVARPKNLGRANATSGEEQASAEIAARYRKELEREYWESEADVDNKRFVQPMLARKWGEVPVFWDQGVYSQPKLDGIRCIASANGLFSRAGKPIVSCPHIWAALEPLLKRQPWLVLDGELYNHELKEDFNSITSIVKTLKPKPADIARAEQLIQYHVYDAPVLDRLTNPFGSRHVVVMYAVMAVMEDNDIDCPVVPVATRQVNSGDQLDELYGQYLEDGYEGQMVRIDGPYEDKRSKYLLKRKEFQDDEYEVVSIEEGQGNWTGYAKRAVLKLPDGREFGAGMAGSQEFLRGVLESRDQFPGTLATVRFQHLTPDGVPRFPVVYRLHGEEGRL